MLQDWNVDTHFHCLMYTHTDKHTLICFLCFRATFSWMISLLTLTAPSVFRLYEVKTNKQKPRALSHCYPPRHTPPVTWPFFFFFFLIPCIIKKQKKTKVPIKKLWAWTGNHVRAKQRVLPQKPCLADAASRPAIISLVYSGCLYHRVSATSARKATAGRSWGPDRQTVDWSRFFFLKKRKSEVIMMWQLELSGGDW